MDINIHPQTRPGLLQDKEFLMPAEVKQLVLSMLRVALPTLFTVATVAFVSIPYSLGHPPGEPPQASTNTGQARHMT